MALIVHFAMRWLFSFSDQSSSFICFTVCTHKHTHGWGYFAKSYISDPYDEIKWWMSECCCRNIICLDEARIERQSVPHMDRHCIHAWIIITCPLFCRYQFLMRLIVSGIIAHARRIIPLHATRPHRYPTRRNTSRLMDLPNVDILELKEKMSELINVM